MAREDYPVVDDMSAEALSSMHHAAGAAGDGVTRLRAILRYRAWLSPTEPPATWRELAMVAWLLLTTAR